MPRDDAYSFEGLKEREAEIREKRERGETLTREEAGLLGAVGSIESTRSERSEAKAEGRLGEFRKEHQVESWTNAPGEAREPHLSEETEREVARIRAKQERGETLTREEAGTLGGASRVEDDD